MPGRRKKRSGQGNSGRPATAALAQAQSVAGRRSAARPGDAVLIYRGIGFPDEFYTNLVYTKSEVVSGFAPTFTQMQSSLFDPDPAVGGQQPLFYDQFAAVYARYQVMAMSAHVQVVNASAIPMSLATAWTDESTLPTTVDQLSTYRYSRSHLLGSAGSPSREWTENMTMARLHGYEDILEVDDLQALVGASPADLAFFTVGTVPYDGSTGGNRLVRVKMTYHVRFFALVTPATS